MTKRILVVGDQAALMSGLWSGFGPKCKWEKLLWVKNGGYLVQRSCLPAGQLGPDVRTRDDAGAIQIWLCATEAC
jgi:hypothetical protein